MNKIVSYSKRHPFISGILLTGIAYSSYKFIDYRKKTIDLSDSWDNKAAITSITGYETICPGLIQVTCKRGFNLPRNMIIIQNRGNYIVHNPIVLRKKELEYFDSQGKPSVLIVPSGIFSSFVDIKAYKTRYPGTKVVCPEEVKKFIPEVTKVDSAETTLLYDYKIRPYKPPGLRNEYNELIYEIDLPKGGTALIFNDIFSNIEPSTGLKHFIYSTLLGIESENGQPRMSKIYKWNAVQTKDIKELKAFLYRLVDNVDKVQVVTFSKGKPIVNDIRSKLRKAIDEI